jgi:hypothetical protein
MKDLPPEGLWISPEGRRIVAVEHMLTIDRYPEKFGLTDADVRRASIPALAKIAGNLIRSGWTRYRHFASAYTFEVDNLRTRYDVIEAVLADSSAYEQEEVVVSQASPRKEFKGTVKDIYDRTLGNYQANATKNKWRIT